eukprot:30864-Pelagococcus_subviridis.AAC.8
MIPHSDLPSHARPSLPAISGQSRSSPPYLEGRSIQANVGVELKGVRWKTAFTTPTRSYGNQCVERTSKGSTPGVDTRPGSPWGASRGTAARALRVEGGSIV